MIDTAKVWELLVREEGSIFATTPPGPLQNLLREFVDASPEFLKSLLPRTLDFPTFLRARIMVTRWQLESGNSVRVGRAIYGAGDVTDADREDTEGLVVHVQESVRGAVEDSERALAAVLCDSVDEIRDDAVLFQLGSHQIEFARISGEAKLALEHGALTVELLLKLQPIVLLVPNQEIDEDDDLDDDDDEAEC